MTRVRLLLCAAALAGTGAGGCVSVGATHDGNPIRWARVAELEPGRTTLAQTLALLGAPDTLQRHPDGTMLMWRSRFYDYTRLGLEPDRLLNLAPLNRAAATVLGNLSLVVEDGVQHEDRVAVLLDHDNVVAGVGIHRGIPR